MSTGLNAQSSGSPKSGTKNPLMLAGGCRARAHNINKVANPTPATAAVAPSPTHHSEINPERAE